MNGSFAVVGLLAVTLLPGSVSAQDVPASQPPPCEISQDAGYGYTPGQAIQVGGSPLYGAARQRRYLDALRGPEGQAVTYKRTGQSRAPDETILDGYVLTYEGLEKPITLYLDWYHFNPPTAPRGFTCAQSFNLGAPPLDPFRESEQVQKLALTQGAVREFTPIPLTDESGNAYGAIYDRFRILANAARMAAGAGAPLDPGRLPKELTSYATVVVAYPLTCEGRTVAVEGMGVTDPSGKLMADVRPMPVEKVAALLPGITFPKGSMASVIPSLRPRQGEGVHVNYMEAACGLERPLKSYRITFAAARGIEMPPATLPESADPGPPMLLQVVVDTDGKIQLPAYIGGALPLVDVAKESLSRWRVEPARANGSPVASGVLLQVRFSPKK